MAYEVQILTQSIGRYDEGPMWYQSGIRSRPDEWAEDLEYEIRRCEQQLMSSSATSDRERAMRSHIQSLRNELYKLGVKAGSERIA